MVVMGPHTAALTSQTDSPVRDGRRAGPGKSGNGPSPAVRHGILTRAVELDVIPRLLLARQPQPAPEAGITLAQVIELTDLTLAPDESGVSSFVAVLQAQGVSAETLYLDLLAPSARRLGVFWVEDICDFTQVTIGVGRLHNAMRALGPAFLATARAGGPSAGRVLLAPLPGEQHTFGLSMVADFFRRAGWDVWTGPVVSREELAKMVRSEWVDVLGFSLACNEQADSVGAEIQAVRHASRNPALAVMVGGPPFLAHPELAAAVGADGTANNGVQAVIEADALMRRTAERHAAERHAAERHAAERLAPERWPAERRG